MHRCSIVTRKIQIMSVTRSHLRPNGAGKLKKTYTTTKLANVRTRETVKLSNIFEILIHSTLENHLAFKNRRQTSPSFMNQ